jgi:hypothetical protein
MFPMISVPLVPIKHLDQLSDHDQCTTCTYSTLLRYTHDETKTFKLIGTSGTLIIGNINWIV